MEIAHLEAILLLRFVGVSNFETDFLQSRLFKNARMQGALKGWKLRSYEVKKLGEVIR